ncbi:hypothetical protein FQA39_LY12864 [Lamprigera yunnana]|nr:hypothetical protein FQA39_LY12864 [Lamprigera yunnana]
MDGTAHHMLGGLVEANIDPIKQTIENGINVFFVTGRPVLAKLNMLEKVAVADNKHSIVVGFENNEKYKGLLFELMLMIANISSKYAIENNKHLLEEGKFFDGEILNYQDVKDDFNFDCFKLIIFDANKEFYDDLRANFELNISTNNNIVAEINEKGINKQFAIK